MHGFSDDFIEFLKTNHTTDYYKAMSDDVKPETLSRIYSDYNNYFQNWIKVPASIRLRYGGRLPYEIIELAAKDNFEALRKIEYNKDPYEEKQSSYIPDYKEIVTSPPFVAAAIAGYSLQASKELAKESLFRNTLRTKAITQTMTKEEKKLWEESRKKTKDIIEKDCAKNQPEKMLLHLFALYNRGKITQDELLPKVTDLMQKIERENRQETFLNYMKDPRIQAKLYHFKPETIELLTKTVLPNFEQKQHNKNILKTIPLEAKIHQLISNYNNNNLTNIPTKIQEIVQIAKKENIGLNLQNLASNDCHPMPAELRQMFMVVCSINNVPYQSYNGEKINTSSDYVKSLPADLQTIIIAKSMTKAKENLLNQTNHNLNKKTLLNNLPTRLINHMSQSRIS